MMAGEQKTAALGIVCHLRLLRMCPCCFGSHELMGKELAISHFQMDPAQET